MESSTCRDCKIPVEGYGYYCTYCRDTVCAKCSKWLSVKEGEDNHYEITTDV